ncbi:MAG: copper transporter [Limnochordia bacterium]
MHIGFRYHVATLVAVFFSLFLGILVGSIIFQDDLLVKEQNSIINELESKFAQLQNKTKELQADLRQAELKEALLNKGWALIRGALIAGMLSDRQIVLFTNTDSTSAKRLATVLNDAGAKIHAAYRWPSEADDVETFAAELAALNLENPIAVAWVDQEFQGEAKQVLDYMKTLKWQVCILQPFTSGTNLADYGQDALVINIGDTYLGELAMVWGLSAGATGVYGRGSATALLPALDAE